MQPRQPAPRPGRAPCWHPRTRGRGRRGRARRASRTWAWLPPRDVGPDSPRRVSPRVRGVQPHDGGNRTGSPPRDPSREGAYPVTRVRDARGESLTRRALARRPGSGPLPPPAPPTPGRARSWRIPCTAASPTAALLVDRASLFLLAAFSSSQAPDEATRARWAAENPCLDVNTAALPAVQRTCAEQARREVPASNSPYRRVPPPPGGHDAREHPLQDRPHGLDHGTPPRGLPSEPSVRPAPASRQPPGPGLLG